MQAIVFDGRLRLTGDRPKPVPARGEVLIRIAMAGICNTDMEITKGYLGFRGIIGQSSPASSRGRAAGRAGSSGNGCRRDKLRLPPVRPLPRGS